MKHLTLPHLLFILAIFMFNACANRAFIPLYPENKIPTQTATLITPIQIDLTYHNGQQKNFVPAYKPLVSYKLPPGKHLLGFRYQDIHYDDNENQEIITSKTVLIQFTAKAGEVYRLDYQKPVNFMAAKQLEDEFQVSLNFNKKILASSTPAPERIEDNHLFSDTAFENKQQDQKVIKQLEYWWIQASQKEREQFIQWID